MMRWMYGDNWQNQYAGNAEMQSRFNQLSNQMSDNHNTDIINEAVKGNSERIINASLMGDKELQATFKDCCCQSKELILRMGYETQLGMKAQTYTINERLTGIANGLQKGFSDLGYILASNMSWLTLQVYIV